MIAKEPPLILHIIHHLVVGGMENGLVNLVNKLPHSRFRHAIVCIDHSSNFRQRITRKDVEVFTLNRPNRGVWAVRKDIYRLCKTLKPAIVHSRNLSGLDALLPARLAGIRYFIHGEHGRDVNDLDGNNRKHILLKRLHKPLINRYITVSKDLQQYLINKIGVNPDQITQIYNGVDTEKFTPISYKPQSVLPEAFVGQNKIVIGTVGRIQAIKDQYTLLQAFSGFLTKYPELGRHVYLAIVGSGPLLEGLRQKAISLEIADRVWLPGSINTIAEILKAFDLFVLPSLAEGISNTILEAMATGLPVIATKVGGNIELVTEGVNGRFFVPKDIDNLIEQIAEYTTNVNLLKIHGQSARLTAIKQFSLTAMISGYQKVYEANCVM